MQSQWVLIAIGVFDLVIQSAALFIISGKLKWKKKWQAWVPGLRFYSLGTSIEMSRDGMFSGILDLLYIVSLIMLMLIREGQMGVIVNLLQLIFFAFFFIYRIRLFLQILRLFHMKRTWIILWLIANWLPLIILGISRKYQPCWELVMDEIPETEETRIPIAKSLCDVVPAAPEGLSIHIKARTVKDFGKKRDLLKDIALNIPKKSLVLLLGGSGAGKTTMINAVIGYEKADAEILLNGADIYKDYNRLKHKIGFVPQQNLIRGKDTVIRTVDDAAKIKLPKTISKEERRQEIAEVMDLLGLSSGEEGLVSKKSGGQLRRICIAMELATDPELFVLDEPDSGLDGVISREIFTKLRQIADEDRIVIVITHTPDRVIDLFDKVIVLGKDSAKTGRLAFYGSPAQAREFFGKESMEQIVLSVNSQDEGGEGRTDELVEKYVSYAAAREGGLVS